MLPIGCSEIFLFLDVLCGVIGVHELLSAPSLTVLGVFALFRFSSGDDVRAAVPIRVLNHNHQEPIGSIYADQPLSVRASLGSSVVALFRFALLMDQDWTVAGDVDDVVYRQAVPPELVSRDAVPRESRHWLTHTAHPVIQLSLSPMPR